MLEDILADLVVRAVSTPGPLTTVRTTPSDSRGRPPMDPDAIGQLPVRPNDRSPPTRAVALSSSSEFGPFPVAVVTLLAELAARQLGHDQKGEMINDDIATAQDSARSSGASGLCLCAPIDGPPGPPASGEH